MKNYLISTTEVRVREIDGHRYEFRRVTDPALPHYPEYREIWVRKWTGYHWENVHYFCSES